MTRGRRQPADDSLEMLLDTITNVFGGIIFIAILVALLTGQRAEQATDRAAAGAAQQVNLTTDITALHAEIERKTELSAYLEGLIVAPDTSWDDVLAQLDDDIVAARRRLRTARQQLDRLRDKQTPIDQKLQAAAATREALLSEIQRLEAQIESEQEQRKLNARLPVTRVTRKAPVHIVLTAGRMFILDRCEGGLDKVLDEDQHDVDYFPGGGGQVQVKLRRAGGTPIGPQFGSHPRWRRLLQAASRDRYFLYFVVLPDAYRDFLTLRQLAVAAGYDYEVEPLASKDELVLVPASELHTQ